MTGIPVEVIICGEQGESCFQHPTADNSFQPVKNTSNSHPMGVGYDDAKDHETFRQRI